MRNVIRAIVSFIEDSLPGILLLSVVLLVTADVGARYIFGSPIRGVSEVALVAMVWIIMLGSARAAKTFQHITVDALVEQFHGRVKASVSLVTTALIIGILATVFFIAVPYVVATIERVLPTFGISRGVITAAVPFGLFLMIAHYVHSFATLVRDIRENTSHYFERVKKIKNIEFNSLMPVTEEKGQLI